MNARQRLRIARAIATDEEIAELAKTVFFSAESEQARQLAMYVVTRYDPRHDLDALDAELSVILADMVKSGELKQVFPNRYRQLAAVREEQLSEGRKFEEALDRAIAGAGQQFTISDVYSILTKYEWSDGPPTKPRVTARMRRMVGEGRLAIVKQGRGRSPTVYVRYGLWKLRQAELSTQFGQV